MNNHAIDIVLPWVDGNDPAWIEEKNKYVGAYGDSRAHRYRDWDNLQYLFRSIEQFAPWVNRVHFVTWGHLPKWLDTENEKLHIVRHEDYMAEEYRPTFSSIPIEMLIHKIQGLADNFILFNDDTFLIRPVKEEAFFIGNVPVDSAVQTIVPLVKKGYFEHVIVNDLMCLNENFKKKECISKNRNKWFDLKYGKGILKNIYLQPVRFFCGFEDLHIPYAYRKETFEEVWNAEEMKLDETCRRKIRSGDDVNQYLFRYWQLAAGRFVPGDPKRGQMFEIGKDDGAIREAIENQKYSMICLNDNGLEEDFEKEKAFINGLLEKAFPDKSSFEL